MQLFNRWLPAATLALWSAVILGYHFTGRLRDLLPPEFRLYALISGWVLAAMAVGFIFIKGDTACCSGAECGHGLSRSNGGRMLAFLILLVPISVAARFSPKEFSAESVKRQGIMLDATASQRVMESAKKRVAERRETIEPTIPGPVNKTLDLPLPTQDGSAPPAPAPQSPAAQPAQEIGRISETPTEWLKRTPDGYIEGEVLDLLYAAQDPALRADFEGKKTQIIAQYMPATTNNPDGNRFKAVRMFVSCCAADAQPVATLVQMEKLPADIKEMEWVKIRGLPTFEVEKGRKISVLKAETVEKTEAPEETMIY